MTPRRRPLRYDTQLPSKEGGVSYVSSMGPVRLYETIRKSVSYITTTALRHALKGVIEDTSRRVPLQKQEGTTAATNPSLIANEES
jgi:hypothetical protein